MTSCPDARLPYRAARFHRAVVRRGRSNPSPAAPSSLPGTTSSCRCSIRRAGLIPARFDRTARYAQGEPCSRVGAGGVTGSSSANPQVGQPTTPPSAPSAAGAHAAVASVASSHGRGWSTPSSSASRPSCSRPLLLGALCLPRFFDFTHRVCAIVPNFPMYTSSPGTIIIFVRNPITTMCGFGNQRVGHSPLAAGTALWHSQEASDGKSAAFWYLYGFKEISRGNELPLCLQRLFGKGIVPGAVSCGNRRRTGSTHEVSWVSGSPGRSERMG